MISKNGFTLIELLVVIAIISILSFGVFVALNPSQRFADSRNVRRLSDVTTISDAIRLYVVDNALLPSGIDDTVRILGTDSTGCQLDCIWQNTTHTSDDACLDLSSDLAPYLKDIPQDPNSGSAAKTLYAVRTIQGIVDVMACNYDEMISDGFAAVDSGGGVTSSLSIYSDWSTGFCATLTVTNDSSSDISSWEVILSQNDSLINNSWNGVFATYASNYSITNESYNGSIPMGNSVTDIGFCADKTGPNYTPTIIQTTGS
jgi:prepilin-type N-terminal cleavage/methylation domain-containing protein